METDGLLPHLQEPGMCLYSEPDQSSSWPLSFFWRSVLILSFPLRMGLPIGLFTSGFPTKTLYKPLLSLYMLHAPPISSFSIWSPEQYWVRNTDH